MHADFIFFYLVLWAEFNEKTGFLVPHEHKSWFDHHDQVNTHLVYLRRQHLHAALDHSEFLISQVKFIILWKIK